MPQNLAAPFIRIYHEWTFVVPALQITGVAVKAWESQMPNKVNEAVDM